jgi:ribokinase
VAAARLGADVRMVGCVGDDDLGRQLLAALHNEGINADNVRTVHGVPTGLAMISVDEHGENLITVAPGANHEVAEQDVANALDSRSDILVICAEIPVPAIRLALRQGKRTLLNLAPAPGTPEDAAAIVNDAPDWLVVNESEAAAVLAHPVTVPAQAAAELTKKGARHAVITVGAHGAALATPEARQTVTAFKVHAVDTVGAGDAFVGALAVALAAGTSPAEAVRAASAAGAAAATRSGAQAGMPRPADILAVTGFTWPQVGSIIRHNGG